MHKYAQHIGVVARELWGDENKALSHGNELRFGSHGSKSVDLEKAVWSDHETEEGGGFIDLCKLAYPNANGSMADFLDERFGLDKDPQFQKTAKGSNTIQTFDYIGDHGVLVYQVIRIDFPDGSKTFRQQQPDGRGGWIKNLKGIDPIPYNLPEVLHHKKAPVIVVEGEKCVERLKREGIIATTNSGGSGKWTDQHSEWLRDRSVIVIPDNDDVGRKHGAKVVNSLIGVAKEVKLLDLSEVVDAKGDIVDYLDSGKTKSQLIAMARKVPAITEALPDPGEIADQQVATFEVLNLKQLKAMPPIEWLVDGLLTRHGFSVMYGQPGCGKTFLALDLALCVASGRDFHGMPVKQGNVLYIVGEGIGGISKRTSAWTDNRGQGCNIDELPFWVLPTAVNFSKPDEIEMLLATIQKLEDQHGKFSLVTVDTVARSMLGADENSATDMGKFVKSCDTVKEHCGCALQAIHHSGKDSSKGMRGSSALMGAVDTSIRVKKSGEQITLNMDKQKDAEPVEDLFFLMKTATVSVGMVSTDTSVYLEKLSDAMSQDARTTDLNTRQLKAMDCMRDSATGNAIDVYMAKDSFFYWLQHEGGIPGDDDKAKGARRQVWKRALDALVERDIVLSFDQGRRLEFKALTNKSVTGVTERDTDEAQQ